MNSQYHLGIPTDVLAAGTNTMGQTIIPDVVFHPGPNELRLTAKGMMYQGELVEDAGAAYAALMKVMNALHLPPLVESWSGLGDAPGHCERINETERAGTGRLDYLADLSWRLVHALRKAAPGHALTATAMVYLQRHALRGSPLREDGAVGPFEPPALINAVDVLQTTIDQVWSEAMQVASRLVIKMTGIPLDALLAGRGVRDRMVDEGENIARALLKLRRDTVSPCPASSALSIHPSVWTDPALNLLREARDTIVDFGPRGTQGEIIADIDKMLKRGVQA